MALRRKYPPTKIPLYRDENTGDEYQIAFHLRSSLVYAFYPQHPVQYDDAVRAIALRRILYHAPPPERQMPQDAIELPRFGLVIGTLTVRRVRTTASLAKVTEWTDYQVVLDTERAAMPLWILCPRRRLQERDELFNGLAPNPPIFRGLMRPDDVSDTDPPAQAVPAHDPISVTRPLGYDAACILVSVHRLGPAERPSYHDACEMVRKTRGGGGSGSDLGDTTKAGGACYWSTGAKSRYCGLEHPFLVQGVFSFMYLY